MNFALNSEKVSALLEDIPSDTELYSSFSPGSDLDEVLRALAISGNLNHDWKLVKRLLRWKIYDRLEKYYKKCGFVGPITETYDSRRAEVLNLLDQYEEAPFTLQRLVEVLTIEPYTQYQSTHKLINALEKLLSVSCSLAP